MASEVNSYRDLVAWQKAFRLGMQIYELTNSFPKDERFGLTSQLRRGAVAVASNIAEGYGRGSRTDYLRFLRIARGALYEIETQLQFAKELNYMKQDAYAQLESSARECSLVLGGLIKRLANP